METNADTIIIGAGITGLCAAHSLHKKNASFQLLDSSNKVGGAIKSTSKNNYLAEHGPNSLLIKDKRISKLLNEIGLPLTGSETLLASEAAKKRYIVQDSALHAMPASPMGMIKTPLFSTKGKLRFALEPFIGKYKGGKEESFASFVRRRLGPDMLASAAGPFVSGIYAGDPEKLSVRHAFPRLWNLEKNYHSFILGAIALQMGIGKTAKNPHRLSPAQMVSFPSGMQQLPQAIANHLPQENIHCSCLIESISQNPSNKMWNVTWSNASNEQFSGIFKNILITIPHHQLSTLPLPEELLANLAPLSKIQSPPVTSLVLGFKREDIQHPLDGFGMLIKQSENSPLLGVLFSSSMFPHRAPDAHVTLTCMMGGSINPHFAKNEESTVLKELNRLLGLTGEPTFRHRTSWKHAIPQYDLHYEKILTAIQQCENSYPNLHLAGNYRGGISVGDCMVNGLELGKNLHR